MEEKADWMLLNCTENPNYYDLVYGIYRTMKWWLSPRMMQMKNYTFPIGFYHDVRDNMNLDFFTDGLTPVTYIALLITIARYMFEGLFCKPLVKRLNFTVKSDGEKFPESLWKFLIYSLMWSYLYYLIIICGKYDYFHNPNLTWIHWSHKIDIPFDIQIIYFVECGFYLHSIYATLYMDMKRRDHNLMLMHHVVTILLLMLSYSFRFYRFGIMTLFFHDINDILLEFTKCNVYLRKRNGRFYLYHERITEIGFVSFLISWCISRLYWFPFKVMYVCGVACVPGAYYNGAIFYVPFTFLLTIILFLNIYWFYLIALIVTKRLIGELSDSNDIREQHHANEKKTK